MERGARKQTRRIERRQRGVRIIHDERNLCAAEDNGIAALAFHALDLVPADATVTRERLIAALCPLHAREGARLGMGLEERLDTPIGLLSGGQRQALTVLMATMVRPALLLLDEHTAALDPKTAAFVLELTAKIVEAGKLTTMMVTHSMRQALDYGSRTVMLHEGRVILDVSGPQRKNMSVEDLLHMFEKTRGEKLDDDKLLLA